MKNALNALVIGASSSSIHAINEAKKLGFTILAFDGNREAEGFDHADICRVLDIRNPELIIQQLEELQITPDIVLPIPIGRYLITSGKINDYYGLTGISFAGADFCTDKYIFHRELSKINLRDINCELIENGTKHLDTERIKKYPAIAKPRYGSGSRMVFAINNNIELKKLFIDNMPYNEDFIIEDLKAGAEYGIDAAIINGKFHLILIRKKMLTPPPYCQCVGSYTLNKSRDKGVLTELLNLVMPKITNAMELNNVLLNADIIYDGNELFLIEISARPSGHNLHDRFVPLATGVNMIREYIKFAVPKLHTAYSFEPNSSSEMLIRYFDFENCKVTKIPNKNVLMDKYPLIHFEFNSTDQIMERIKDGQAIMKRGFFILKGESMDELMTYSKDILNEFELENI